MLLTTTSLNGAWVSETSRSFYYWQPANPTNQAISSPHAEQKMGTCHVTDEIMERGLKEGGTAF